MWLSTALPERIELDDLVLRQRSVEDSRALVEAINRSREQLRPWLPFVNDDEAVSEAALRQQLEQVPDQWDSRTLFTYTIVTHRGTFAGFIEVRPRPESRASVNRLLAR